MENLTKQEKQEKNKKAISAILLIIGVCFLISSIVVAMSISVSNAFFYSLIGTILIFIANYIKNGYIKFFN